MDINKLNNIKNEEKDKALKEQERLKEIHKKWELQIQKYKNLIPYIIDDFNKHITSFISKIKYISDDLLQKLFEDLIKANYDSETLQMKFKLEIPYLKYSFNTDTEHVGPNDYQSTIYLFTGLLGEYKLSNLVELENDTEYIEKSLGDYDVEEDITSPDLEEWASNYKELFTKFQKIDTKVSSECDEDFCYNIITRDRLNEIINSLEERLTDFECKIINIRITDFIFYDDQTFICEIYINIKNPMV